MDFKSKEETYSKKSILTVIEISQKITELLDTMEYSNNEMIITKEHIKYSLNQLIRSSAPREKNVKSRITSQRNRHQFLNSFSVDNRGKLKAGYYS